MTFEFWVIPQLIADNSLPYALSVVLVEGWMFLKYLNAWSVFQYDPQLAGGIEFELLLLKTDIFFFELEFKFRLNTLPIGVAILLFIAALELKFGVTFLWLKDILH